MSADVRFLHTSDVHLGMRRRRLDVDAGARFVDARLEAVERLGPLAAAEGAEFVVVAGDVFDSNHLDRRIVARALEAFAAVGRPVHLLPGNHDPLDGASIYLSPEFERRPADLHVITEPGVLTIAPGVELVAAPWRGKNPPRNPFADALDLLPDGPATAVRIGLAHGTCLSLTGSFGADAAAVDESALNTAITDRRLDYVALGDRHSAVAVDACGRVRYSGSPEVTDFVDDPTTVGGVLSIRIGRKRDAAGLRPVGTTWHRTGSWSMRALSADMDCDADIDHWIARLEGLPDRRRTLVRHSLRGTLSLAQHARLEAEMERQQDVFAALYAHDRHTELAVLPGDGEFADLRLTGYAATAVAELETTARAGGADAEAASDALRLLYRLAGGHR